MVEAQGGGSSGVQGERGSLRRALGRKGRGDADNVWMKMATCIRKVASEEFGVSRGRRSEDKDT